jgi:hypothetical protein
VYAPQHLPVPAPVALRLIGLLDAELVTSFAGLSDELIQPAGGTLLVDVRDLHVPAEVHMDALVGAIRAARAAGRDVRLDAKSLPWRRLLKAEPLIDAPLRAAVRRTVIMAHSGQNGKKKKR